jgi:hypothetical protein
LKGCGFQPRRIDALEDQASAPDGGRPDLMQQHVPGSSPQRLKPGYSSFASARLKAAPFQSRTDNEGYTVTSLPGIQ